MLANDLLLRPVFPGWITGKLSDLGFLVVFPVVLAAIRPLALLPILAVRVAEALVVVGLSLAPPDGAQSSGVIPIARS